MVGNKDGGIDMASKVKVLSKHTKKRLVFMPDVQDKVLIKDGIKYRMIEEVGGKDGHVKKVIFEEFDEADFNKRIDALAEYLVNESGLSAKDVLVSVLNGQAVNSIERLEQKMKKHRRVKIKKGCLNLRMGNAEIPICD